MTAYEGGCLCGAIRFRATGTPASLARCHCRSCRMAAGSPGVPWVTFRRDAFEVLEGELATYRSSPPVVRTFCGRCGTSVSYQNEDSLDTIDLCSAIFDDPAPFAPRREIWLEDHVAWTPLDPALDQYLRDSRGPKKGGA